MTTDIGNLQNYSDLLQTIQPRIIRSELDAAAMNDIVDVLTDVPSLSDDQRDFVGLLGQLIHDWEAVHEVPIEVSPRDVVTSLLEDNGLRQVDLVGPVFPSASTVSDFLHDRRPLSYERVMKLAAFFHVSPAVFFPTGADTSIESLGRSSDMGGRPLGAAPTPRSRRRGATGSGEHGGSESSEESSSP